MPDRAPTTYSVAGGKVTTSPRCTTTSSVSPSAVTALTIIGAMGVRAKTVGVMAASQRGQSARRAS
jgi:hypothetical protein